MAHSASGGISPDLVIRTYRQEAAKKHRGAYRRAGDRLGLTDERVRQIVKADEEERQLLFTLAYVMWRKRHRQTCQAAVCQLERDEPPTRPIIYVKPYDPIRHNATAANWAPLLPLSLLLLTSPVMVLVWWTVVLFVPMVLAAVWLVGDVQAHYRRINAWKR